MATEVERVWQPLGPQRFIDQRIRLTRESGAVRQNVRAHRGVIVRKGPKGPIYDSCPHAHNKAHAARACAEKAARRVNQAIAKGEQWAIEKGLA